MPADIKTKPQIKAAINHEVDVEDSVAVVVEDDLLLLLVANIFVLFQFRKLFSSIIFYNIYVYIFTFFSFF